GAAGRLVRAALAFAAGARQVADRDRPRLARDLRERELAAIPAAAASFVAQLGLAEGKSVVRGGSATGGARGSTPADFAWASGVERPGLTAVLPSTVLGWARSGGRHGAIELFDTRGRQPEPTVSRHQPLPERRCIAGGCGKGRRRS